MSFQWDDCPPLRYARIGRRWSFLLEAGWPNVSQHHLFASCRFLSNSQIRLLTTVLYLGIATALSWNLCAYMISSYIITVQTGPEIGVLLGSHFAGVPSATESQSSITCWSHEWTYCMYFFQCVQPWCCASLLRHSPTRKDCIRPAGAGTARMR